jgi:Tol biopolymer transport system component
LALTPGTRLSVYEIITPIGEGGMGQVYRARDTKLDRDVAIKILPGAFVHDADRLARFTREAKTLAALNHPHIAGIYGLEESGGVSALVMELVEGDDLSQRIARGAVPLDEALPIAKQIAEALEAAHEQGIIHRDLKPANIKMRGDGTVKVLDFGLAKALDPAGGRPEDLGPKAQDSPTITSPAMTMRGVILGTAAYMSPEQAAGKPVDKRSDLWAFGVVLLEMLTGRPVFTGETVSHVIASVLKSDPDWTRLPADTPAAIRRLLRRCLEKDRKRRLTDAGVARLEIDEALGPPSAVDGENMASSPSRVRLAWTVAAVALLTAGALMVPALRDLRQTPPPAPPEMRVDLVTPPTDDLVSFALSPDGRQIVYVGSGDGGSRLWLRSLSTTTAQPLAGTEGATFPFWAPDSRSVGFFAGGALKRLDLGGGAPQTVAPANAGRGGMWNTDGVILVAPSTSGPLMRVSATGGEVVAATTLEPQQSSHRWPLALPDGRRFLFYVFGAPATAGIYLGAFDGTAPTRLTPADSAGVYLPEGPRRAGMRYEGGWLLWVRAGTLVAQRLDVSRRALTGELVTLADGVATDGTLVSAVSVAATGLVAYRTAGDSRRQLTWVDRSGKALGTLGAPDQGNVAYASLAVSLSPDCRRVAVTRRVEGNSDIWLLDGARMSRATFDAGVDQIPLWSPDSTRIVFNSNRTGQFDLYQKLTSGAGVEERLVASDQFKAPTSWSADGRFLLYHSIDPETSEDLWIVPMTGESTPSLFLRTPFRESWGAFSPNGRWVAYMSNESGRMEIYVRPFAGPAAAGAVANPSGGQWQVSTAGGVYPRWRPDGRELFYLNAAGEMMAAKITINGPTLAPGVPVTLFSRHTLGAARGGRTYDVAQDGRFLFNTVLDGGAAPITLIQNWNPEAKK